MEGKLGESISSWVLEALNKMREQVGLQKWLVEWETLPLGRPLLTGTVLRDMIRLTCRESGSTYGVCSSMRKNGQENS